MKDETITLETATLAKEKGYGIPCKRFYYTPNSGMPVDSKIKKEHETKTYTESRCLDWNNYEYTIGIRVSAPTQSLLQQWFRETYNMFVVVQIDETSNPKFGYSIHRFIGNPKDLTEKEWYWEVIIVEEYLETTYPQALEKGLQEALELIDTPITSTKQ